MKKLFPALAVAALALAGCTSADPAPEPAAPVESSPAAVVSASPTAEPVEAPKSVEQIKAEQIANGRPAAAWDIDCVAWEMPEPDSEGQAWANEVGQAWLKSHSAKCPDAIEFPQYYVDSFEQGEHGELILIMDKEIMHEYVVTNTEDSELRHISMGLLERVREDHPELHKVTARVNERSKERSSDIADLEEWTAIQGTWYGFLGDES